MGKRVSTVVAILLLTSPLNHRAFASGFLIYEHGARAMALAGTITARGGDPSVIFYNPAGLTGLSGTQLYVGTTLIFPDGKFAGMDPYPGFGVVEKYKSAVFFPSNFYISHQLLDRLTVGFGFFSPFGLVTEWDGPETFSGRFIAERTQLTSYFFNPTVAYQMMPQVSIAVGLNLVASHIELHRHNAEFVDGVAFDVVRGNLRANNGPALGFNGGITVRPVENLSFGFSYRSEIENNFDNGKATFTQKSTGNPALDAVVAAQLPQAQNASTTLDYPAMWSAGINYAFTDRFNVEFDLNWTGWSSFGELDILFEDPTLNIKLRENWDDTYSYRAGVQYKATERLMLYGGYIYDQAPQPTASLSPLLPDADRNDICFGLGYSLGRATIELSNMFVLFKDRSTEGISRDGYNGEYRVSAYLLGLDLAYSF